MDMHVRDDGHSPIPAEPPQVVVIAAIEPDDPGIEAMRIKVVIENEIRDPRATVEPLSEEECAAFPRSALSPLAQGAEQAAPEGPRARDSMLRRAEAGYNRRN